jgi:hypothetical protein
MYREGAAHKPFEPFERKSRPGCVDNAVGPGARANERTTSLRRFRCV